MLLISYKASEAFKNFLRENNISYILTCKNPKLDPRISDHPDLSVFRLDDKNIVIADSVYDYYKNNLDGYKLIRGEDPEKTYPKDAIYNVVSFKDFYIHNDQTEANIKKYFKNTNIAHIKVRQGYTRCSIIPLKERLLTADYGIYKALKDRLDIGLLDRDKIILDGFDEGFLGGCGGVYEDKLIFTGDISRHKSYGLIKKSAEDDGLRLLYPKGLDLVDLGSLISL